MADVLRALLSSEFDDLSAPKLSDSDTAGEDPMPVDTIVNGDTEFLHCNDITAVRWFDEPDVSAISTIHGNVMILLSSKQQTSDSEKATKPELIDDYNESTSGVDKCDQLLVYYAVNRKTTKW